MVVFVYLFIFLLDWFQLTGLIHDLGKVLALWGEPQVRLSIAQEVLPCS